MGSFKGHAVPGSVFLLISSWWYLNVFMMYAKMLRNGATSPGLSSSRFKSTTWFPIPCRRLRKIPCEPIAKIVLTTLGIALEMFPENAWVLIEKNGEFRDNSLNNYSHAAMYSFFLFSGLLESLQFWNIIALPKASEHLALSFALFFEGLLFFFHLDGRPLLDKRLHVLLFVVVFSTSMILLLEAWMKNSFLLLVARVYLTMLQGTWFFQIAHSLYGANPWKDTAPNREFVTIALAWHALVLLFVCLGFFVLVSVKVRGSHNPSLLEDIEVQTIAQSESVEPERSSLIDSEDADDH